MLCSKVDGVLVIAKHLCAENRSGAEHANEALRRRIRTTSRLMQPYTGRPNRCGRKMGVSADAYSFQGNLG